jgi:RecB family exonuclease
LAGLTRSPNPTRTLRIVASRERAAVILRERVRSEGVALGLGVVDLTGFEGRLLAAAELEPLSTIEARLLLAALAPAAARGTSLAAVAEQPGFAAGFARLWDSLRLAGIDAAGLTRVAERLARDRHTPALSARRFAGLAAIARDYEAALARLGRVDAVGARVRLPAAIAELGRARLVALSDGAEHLAIEAGTELPLARVRAWEALARAGLAVTVEVPVLPAGLGDVAPELAGALEQLRRNLVEAAPSVALAATPLASRANPGLAAAGLIPFVSPSHAAALVGPGLRERLSLVEAEDARAELRGVTAAIREQLHAGVAPHHITVAVPRLSSPGVQTRLRAALDAAEIPHQDRRGHGWLAAAPLRLSFALIDCAARELPREALAAVLESAYVGRRDAPLLLAALRRAGSRDDRGLGHIARLRAHAAKLSRGPHPDQLRRAKDARLLLALASRWEPVLACLRLPARARVRDHVDALFAALRTLGIPRRSLALPELAARGEAAARRLERAAIAALARDRAALEALELAAAELDEAATTVGLGERGITLAEFQAQLEAALAGVAGPRGTSLRGAGIVVTELAALAQTETEQLFVVHAVEGELPGAGRSLPLLDDDDRQRLERAAGRPIFAAPVGVDAAGFALACAGARERLWISSHREDAEGRELGRSRYFDALAHALADPVRTLAAGVVPELGQCSTRAHLHTRLAHLARRGAGELARAVTLADPRGAPDEARLAALAPALAWAQARAAELGRARVELRGQALVDAHAQLGFVAAGPTTWRGSATSLEDYAACPFRFFAARVLRVRPRPSVRDELDAAEQGSVRHEVLAAVMAALRDAGLTPLVGGDRIEAETRVALAAAEAILDRWQRLERTGPAPLWLLHRDLVIRDLLRTLEGERRAAIEAWEPGEFEVGFGVRALDGSGAIEGVALTIPDRQGQRRLELIGRVDRIDYRGHGREREGLVLDYKSGRVGDRLRADELARTALQLPLYAAWLATRDPTLRDADAAYVSLRDGERSHASLLDLCLSNLDLDGLIELDPVARAQLRDRAGNQGERGEPAPERAVGALELARAGQRNLADNVWALLGGVAAGRFDVRPHDPGRACRYCAYASVCRVERGDELDPAAGGGPA